MHIQSAACQMLGSARWHMHATLQVIYMIYDVSMQDTLPDNEASYMHRQSLLDMPIIHVRGKRSLVRHHSIHEGATSH